PTPSRLQYLLVALRGARLSAGRPRLHGGGRSCFRGRSRDMCRVCSCACATLSPAEMLRPDCTTIETAPDRQQIPATPHLSAPSTCAAGTGHTSHLYGDAHGCLSRDSGKGACPEGALGARPEFQHRGESSEYHPFAVEWHRI